MEIYKKQQNKVMPTCIKENLERKKNLTKINQENPLQTDIPTPSVAPTTPVVPIRPTVPEEPAQMPQTPALAPTENNDPVPTENGAALPTKPNESSNSEKSLRKNLSMPILLAIIFLLKL